MANNANRGGTSGRGARQPATDGAAGLPAASGGGGIVLTEDGQRPAWDVFGGPPWIKVESQHGAPGTLLARLAHGVAQR